MATTKKRTTKQLSAKQKALVSDVRAATQRDEDPVRPLYRTMSPQQKEAFLRVRAS
jgi:hypothetical protein